MTFRIGVKCEECGLFGAKTECDVHDTQDKMCDLLTEVEKLGWEVDWEEALCVCPVCCESRKENLPDKILWTTYLNSNKEQNWEMVDEIESQYNIKLPDEAREQLHYCLYELELRLEIDTKTGNYKILSYKE